MQTTKNRKKINILIDDNSNKNINIGLFNKIKSFIKENYAGYLFTLPLTLGILIFTLYPIIQSLYYSFHIYNGFNKFIPIGLENYSYMFNGDLEFYKVIGNTFIYALISVPLMLILSYFVALLVNLKVKSVTIFRLFYYLPCVIPGVVAGVMWKDIMNESQGALNTILSSLSLPTSTFFAAAQTSMQAVIIMGLWGVGGGMVLWIAAFKNIPSTLYEAAKIDGANAFQRLIVITIPMSTPMIFYNLITGIIGSLQINSTLIFAPRSGRGMGDSIYFFAVKIYLEAFDRSAMGYACSLAWILFIIIGILTFIVFKTSKWVFYAEEV